jgi:hypothetical protein
MKARRGSLHLHARPARASDAAAWPCGAAGGDGPGGRDGQARARSENCATAMTAILCGMVRSSRSSSSEYSFPNFFLGTERGRERLGIG